MNKEKVMEELGDKVLQIINGIETLAINELPDVCTQVLAYNEKISLIIMILSFVFLILFLIGAGIGIYMKEYTLKDDFGTVLFLLSGSCLVISSFVFMGSLFEYIKVTTTPKVYLLEYFTGLI